MNKLGFLENYGEELIIQKMTGISVMNTFHIHPQYEIYFCPKDIKQKSVINGIEYEYKHPAVILSKPYSIHSMSCMETSNTDFERYVIYFSPTNESFLNTNNLPDIIIGEKAGLLFKLTEAEANSLKNIFSFFLSFLRFTLLIYISYVKILWNFTPFLKIFTEKCFQTIKSLEEDYEYQVEIEYDYSEQMIKGVLENIEAIDNIISNSLVKYTIDRLSYVDRAIIRLATYEMKFLNLAKEVAIDEALLIVVWKMMHK